MAKTFLLKKIKLFFNLLPWEIGVGRPIAFLALDLSFRMKPVSSKIPTTSGVMNFGQVAETTSGGLLGHFFAK